jgi:hypothetical protein
MRRFLMMAGFVFVFIHSQDQRRLGDDHAHRHIDCGSVH